MFVNCKYCNALVATDPATDLPPERCPRCAGLLREPPAGATPPVPAEAPPSATVATASTPPTLSSLLRTPAAAVSPSESTPVAAPEPASADADPTTASAAAAHADADAAPPPEHPTPHAGGGDAPGDLSIDDPVRDPARDPRDASRPVDAPVEAPVDTAAERPVDDAVVDDDAEHAAAAATGDGATATTTGDDLQDNAAPAFLPTRSHGAALGQATRRRWIAPALVAMLSLLLALQVLVADRARLAADAQWRPLVTSLCAVLGCAVPAWREPAAFTLLAREIRPLPQASGALRVEAVFRNDARWTQDWPQLVLTLSDINGHPVASRAFAASEYLAEPARGGGLGSGDSARIRFDLHEPATATVSYSFDFR